MHSSSRFFILKIYKFEPSLSLCRHPNDPSSVSTRFSQTHETLFALPDTSDFVEADAERGFRGSSVTILLSDGEGTLPQGWQPLQDKIPVGAATRGELLLLKEHIFLAVCTTTPA